MILKRMGAIAMLVLTASVAYAKPIKIAVSVSPLVEFVQAVGQDEVQVTHLLPESLCPHDYQMKPSQMKDLLVSDGLVLMGSGFLVEEMIARQLQSLQTKIPMVRASKGLNLIEAFSDKHIERGDHAHRHTSVNDPHIWMSLKNVHLIVDQIVQFLSQIRPEQRDLFEANAKQYQDRLQAVHQDIQSEIEQKRISYWFVVHPSWGYFVRDYGLQQISIEQYGQEPSVRHMMEFSDLMKKSAWTHILVASAQEQRMGEVMAQSTGATLLLVNPVSINYLEQMERLVELLQNTQIKEQ